MYGKFLEIFDPNNKRKSDRTLRNHYASIKRDYKAIERILYINNRWNEKNDISKDSPDTSKYLFLYLSNTRMSEFYYQKNVDVSKKMKNYYDSLRQEIDPHKPLVLDSNFNPHRVPAQIFLQILLRGIEQKEGDIIETERRLNIIKGHILNPEENSKELFEVMNTLSKEYKTILKKENNLENYLLIEKLSLYKEVFKNAKEKLSLKSHTILYKHLEELLKEVTAAKYQKKIHETINSTFVTLSNTNVVFNFIESLKDNTVQKLGFKGSDNIDLLYQALPIVIHHSKDKNYEKVLNEFIYRLIDLDFNQDKLLKSIDKAFSTFKSKSGDDPSIAETYNDYIKLIILSLIHESTDNLNINISNYRSNEVKLILTKDLDPEARSNFLYIAATIARRDQKYRDAKAYADEGIKNYSNDPRFYHSKALIIYCKNRPKKLDNAIKNFRLAKKKYEDLTGEDTLRDLALESVINSLAHCLALKYENKNDTIFLTESRELLKVLKEKASERYERVSEYLFTEAIIEYHESIQAEKDKNEHPAEKDKYDQLAKYKIERAGEVIGKFNSLKSTIHGLTRKIDEQREKLFEQH